MSDVSTGNTMMVQLYKPALEDLWFRCRMMADPETMSYNRAWGGTIPFPRKDWPVWYDRWIAHPEGKRYYRYVVDASDGSFVGEIAYHLDEERGIWCADVIIAAWHRHKGYGSSALQMLCLAAKENGVDILRDDIARDNPAAGMFLGQGFTEEYRTDAFIMLKKDLRD